MTTTVSTAVFRVPVLPVLAALLGLVASLGSALIAQPGASRVAVLMLPGFSDAWTAIDRSGLPVVQVMLGGMLVVVDGRHGPDGMAALRTANLLLLDASLVPGCADPSTFQQDDKAYGPDT